VSDSIHVDPDAQFPDYQLNFRQSDTLPTLYFEVIDEFGNTYDLTGKGVRITWTRIGGDADTNEVPLVRDATPTGTAGQWQYDVAESDTERFPGTFELTAEVYDLTTGATEVTAPTLASTYLNIRGSELNYVTYRGEYVVFDDGWVIYDNRDFSSAFSSAFNRSE